MLQKYIHTNFDKCVRVNTEDKGEHIGLPYPYTVPCVSGMFQEMYYWDTYFTNLGLILSDKLGQAKNNTDNILYLVERFGYMPNGNRTNYLKTSQPPFLSLMVKDIYEKTGDKEWLRKAAKTIQKEYSFWMKRRITPCGLNRYGINREQPGCDNLEEELIKRLGFEPPIDGREKRIEHFAASCESGWDLTPRFGYEAFNYAPVDLNCLLYAFESNMAYFCEELGDGDPTAWRERAKQRAELMKKLMTAKDGCMYDYNFVSGKLSPVLSAASFFPLFVGMLTKSEAYAAHKRLMSLEMKCGITACEKNDLRGNYQWDYPNAWACLQMVAAAGLINYGFTDDAVRLAVKFTSMVENCYQKTGNLWEKYNAEDGGINTVNEYEMPPMLGWTAGTYLYLIEICKKYLNGGTGNE